MNRLDFEHIESLFPEHIREQCMEEYRKAKDDGYTESEVRHDEAQKAEWTYNRQRTKNDTE